MYVRFRDRTDHEAAQGCGHDSERQCKNHDCRNNSSCQREGVINMGRQHIPSVHMHAVGGMCATNNRQADCGDEYKSKNTTETLHGVIVARRKKHLCA